MSNYVFLKSVRPLAEQYVKTHLPDEYPFFSVIWTELIQTLSTAAAPRSSKDAAAWLSAFSPAFSQAHSINLMTPAVILVLEATARELGAELVVPEESQVLKAISKCAEAFGVQKERARQMALTLAAPLHSTIKTLLQDQKFPSSEPIPQYNEQHANLFKKTGGVWEIQYGGKRILVPDQKGMLYFQHLLKHSRSGLWVWELFRLVEGANLSVEERNRAVLPPDSTSTAALPEQNSGPPTCDVKTLVELRSKRNEFEQEINRLKAEGREAEANECETEINTIDLYISNATWQGTIRHTDPNLIRLKKSVGEALTRAADKIRQCDHEILAQHLENSIRFYATRLIYQPDADHHWQV